MRPASHLLLLALLLATAACTRRSPRADQAPEVDLLLEVEPSPPAVGQAVLYLILTSSDGIPIEGAELSVRVDMTHAGMQPVLRDAVHLGEGRYQVPFEWTMNGNWILTVEGTLPDGRKLLRTFALSVGGSGR